jgi:hypothetical protein
MAGILSNSASVTMTAGDTSVDNAFSGYVVAEQCILSVTDSSPASVEWGLSIPTSSTPARSGLSASTGSSVTFTPDVGGTYTITANVDGTNYVLRMTVAAVTVTQLAGGIRFSPMTDTSVPAPAAGVTMYYSSTQSGLAIKDSSNSVSTVDVTAVP